MSTSLLSSSEKRPKVLATDDDAAIRRSLQLLLHAKGYDAQSYTTASALLADDDARLADCIIVDYNMPDINGLSLLRALRANGWKGAAILITAYGNDELTKRAKACGYAEVITKPFIRRPILDALQRFCECRQAGDCAHQGGGCAPDCDC